MTKRRGFFRAFTAAVKLWTLGSLAVRTRRWDSSPSRKNQIEFRVERLNPLPKADIKVTPAKIRLWRQPMSTWTLGRLRTGRNLGPRLRGLNLLFACRGR